MTTIIRLSCAVTIATLSLLLVCVEDTHAEITFSVDTSALIISDLITPKKVFQCVANERKLRTILDEPVQEGLRLAIATLSITPSDEADSYHCCDGTGNCSGPVDALTICPVLKVWCRYEGNQCICD